VNLSKILLCVLAFFYVVACGDEDNTVKKNHSTTTVAPVEHEHGDVVDVID